MTLAIKILIAVAVLVVVGVRAYQLLPPTAWAWLKARSKYVCPVVAVLAGLVALWLSWEVLIALLQSPSLDEVWKWTKNHWLSILVIGAIVGVGFSFVPEVGKTLAVMVAVGVATLFIVIPLVHVIRDNQSPDCVPGHPCEPQTHRDGSTDVVKIPEGQWVCFDHSFWDNLSQLGYRTSFRGGPEKMYGCTRDAVLSGKCDERMGDAFRFTPTAGVSVPKYWFTPKQAGSNC